ncbi:MAG: hypothetical protein HY319_06055 [Armatimonadetes bacterium]|nr:hypothetical protein [Armatimonadota bacterium]
MRVLWMLVAAVLLSPWPAQAQVTVAGKLESLKRDSRELVLVRKDGTRKRVQLVQNAKFEMAGNASSISAFREGMQVSLRLCGALNDEPLQANLLMDVGSSGKYVMTAARTPYYTRHGDFATTAGAGGRPGGVPGQDPTTTVGILGNGGQLPETPYNNPNANPNDPNHPLNPMNPQNPTNPYNQGARMSTSQNLMNGMMGMEAAEGGPPATGLMGDQGQGSDFSSEGYLPGAGSQIQVQGVVVSADMGQRVMVVQPVGSPTPQNVVLAPNALIQPGVLSRGSAVTVTGMSSPDGYVQATAVTSSSALPGYQAAPEY